MQEDQFKRITRELQTERRNHKQVRVFFVSGLRQGGTCIMQIESFVPVQVVHRSKTAVSSTQI